MKRLRKSLKRNRNILGFIFFAFYVQILNYSLPTDFLSAYCYGWILGHVIVIILTFITHQLYSPIIYGTHQHLIVFLSTSYPIYVFIKLPSNENIDANYIFTLFLQYLHTCTIINIILTPFQSEPSKTIFSQPMTFKWYRWLIRWPGEIHYTTSLISIGCMPFVIFDYIYLNYFSLQILSFGVILNYLSTFIYCSYTLFFSLSDDIKNWTHITINMTQDAKNSSKVQHCNKIISHKHKNNGTINDGITVYQITDTHVDSYWSALQLNNLCEKVVQYDPDLILLTGDFYFTHNHAVCGDLLYFALLPLSKVAYKSYGCLGNHDLKDNKITKHVEDVFFKLNIKLLRNEIVFHKSSIGNIQIIGFDYVFKYQWHLRKSFMQNVMNNKAKNEKTVVLLHDPFAFDEFKGDENICAFSGHTHGGHLGLWLLGITRFSVFRLVLRLPDLGLFVKGNNKMYVHRGNVFWAKSFLRVGVPCEYSCIKLGWDNHN